MKTQAVAFRLSALILLTLLLGSCRSVYDDSWRRDKPMTSTYEQDMSTSGRDDTAVSNTSEEKPAVAVSPAMERDREMAAQLARRQEDATRRLAQEEKRTAEKAAVEREHAEQISRLEAERKRQVEDEQARLRAEQEQQRLRAQQQQARLKAEEERRRLQQAAQRKKEEARRMAEEAEKERLRLQTIAEQQAESKKRSMEAQMAAADEKAVDLASIPDSMMPKSEAIAAITKEAVAPEPAFGNISGMVRVLTDGKEIKSENVIITLEPEDESGIPQRAPKMHVIDMKNKRFVPRYNVVRVGDSVKFKNFDPFLHNVFSRSGDNKFDLGTYGKGTEPEHTFVNPGIVKTYCNIHPSMACFIMTSTTDWYAITGDDGQFSISDIPAGNYTVTAWTVRGEVEQDVTIKPDETTTVSIDIDTSSYRKVQHLNKFGKRYKRQRLNESY